MTVKEKLYKFIVEEKPTSLIKWQKFQSKCPQVRIKTVGSNRTVLINLEEHGEWFEPSVWAGNYEASIKQRLASEVARAKNILSQEALDRVLGTQSGATTTAQPVDAKEIRKMLFTDWSKLLEANVDSVIDIVNEGDVRRLLDLDIRIAAAAFGLMVSDEKRWEFIRRALGE